MSSSLAPLPELPAWPAMATPSLADQLLALRRRWLTLLLCLLLAPALAALILARLPAHYTATAIVLYDPMDATPPGLATPNLDAQVQNDVVLSQAAIIDSLPTASAIAGTLKLAQNPEFNHALAPPPWSAWLRLGRPPGPDDVALAVRDALSVTVQSGADVLSIAFTSRSPDISAAAVNLAVGRYIDHQRDQSFADLTAAQSWLENHETALRGQLTGTEQALAQARAAAGLTAGPQTSISAQTASQLAGDLVGAKADLAMAQARLASASSGDAAAANAAIAPNILPLRTQAAGLQAQVNALASRYGADYPDLAADRAQLGAIDAAIGAETGRELDAARAEVAADQARVASLTGALGQAQTQSQAQDADTAPIRALEQRESALQDMLHGMDMQAGQLAQQAALTRTDAQIISAAAPPDQPDSRKTPLVLAAAALLGGCLGFLLAALADALDSSFYAGGDLRAETGLPCLAVVPATRRPGEAPLDAPYSLFAEQMRGLRTALVLPGAGRVIAITAARPGEGKTTLSIALARALAAAGLAVAAVDGDIRQPSFDAYFKTGGGAGLTDVLAGLAKLQDVTRPDPRGNLQIISAGTQGADALSLFLSPALPKLLDELRAAYDVVLLDVPPAFALAEARVLARMADTALLCVRWGHTPRRVVRAAIVLLREAQVTLVGTALTRVNAKRHRNSGFPDAEMYQPRYGGYFRG